MIININTEAKVTLTQHGKAQLALYESIHTKPPVPPLTANEDGTLTLPLWKMMNIFGGDVQHARSDLPFVDNRMELFCHE